MTKAELAARVAAQASMSRAGADAAVNAMFSTIADALADGETVTIAGFGTFSTKSRSPRQGRNSRTEENITIAASNRPSFNAGKTRRDAVNESLRSKRISLRRPMTVPAPARSASTAVRTGNHRDVRGKREGFRRSIERGNICAVHTRALQASLVVAPHTWRHELNPAAAMRTGAQTTYYNRFRGSCGERHSCTRALRSDDEHDVPGTCTNHPSHPTAWRLHGSDGRRKHPACS